MNKLIIAFVLLFLTGCKNNHPVELNTAQAKPEIETVKIEKGTLASTIKIPGELKPFERVDIYPKVNGFVKDVLVDLGSSVHAGQVLMILEAPEIDQQLQAAQSKLIQTTQVLNASRDHYLRLQSAAKTPGTVSDLDMMSALSKYQADSATQQAEAANVTGIKTLKDYLVVKAPFEGVITERNVHPGTLTGPNFKMDKPLLVLQNNKKLRLEVFLPEVYANATNKDPQKITFTTSAIPGKIFDATIARSANAVGNNYRSEALEADISNNDNLFKPGMFLEVQLKTNGQISSFIVPTSAIVTSTEGKYVTAVINGKTKNIHLTEGVSENGKTEIFGNFNGDELILKTGNAELPENETIK